MPGGPAARQPVPPLEYLHEDKFSWNAVATAAIGGGISGGLGAIGFGGSGAAGAALRGATSSAISQGMTVALGLQDRFNWAAVAAAGAGAAAGQWLGGKLADPGSRLNNAMDRLSARIGERATDYVAFGLQSGAALLASAATRNLIEGSDFGDNLLAALPETIGKIFVSGLAGQIGDWMVADPTPAPDMPDPSDAAFQITDPVQLEEAALTNTVVASLAQMAIADPEAMLALLDTIPDADGENKKICE